MFTVALGIILMKINLDNADQDKNYISGYLTSFQIINKNKIPNIQSCDKFQNGIREVFLSFPGGF